MSSSRIAKIKRNAASLFAGDLFTKASTFCVYAMVGRYAGTLGFGQIALGLFLLYLFNVFAAGGLPVLVTRLVAKDPERSNHFLYNGYLAAIITSAASTLVMLILARVMGYAPTTVTVITILATAIAPYAMTMIAEAVIRGREEMRLVAIANIPGNVFMVIASAYVLLNDYGIVTLAVVIASARFITFAAANMLIYLSCKKQNVAPAQLQVSVAWGLLKRSMVFLGSDGINALWHAMDGLILSWYASESQIGLLQSSFQLLQPALMVYRSIGHSSFPALVDAARAGPDRIAEISGSLIGYMLRLSLPAAVAMFVLAEDVLVTVYSDEGFRAGGIVLKILSVTLVLDLISPVFGHGLYAVSKEKTVLRIVICNLIVSCLAALVLISQFGLVGAAFSVLTSTIVNVFQHNWYFQRQVVRLPLWREAVKVLPGAVVLIACVALLPTHRFISLAIGVVIYFAITFPQLRSPFWKSPQPNAVVS